MFRDGQKVRDLLPTPHFESENSDQIMWLVPTHTTPGKHIWNLPNDIIPQLNLSSWSCTPQINFHILSHEKMCFNKTIEQEIPSIHTYLLCVCPMQATDKKGKSNLLHEK